MSVSIGKANLRDAVITLGNTLTYNGESQTQSVAKVEAGTMTLGAGDFTYASDYAIVIDTEPMGAAPNGTSDTNAEAATSESGEKDAQTGAEARNDAWNPWWIIVIGILVMVIGLGVFLAAKKKKSEDEE